MPHPSWDIPEPFNQQRLTEDQTCPKCGQVGPPRLEYGRAETVYSACDLHYPERISLLCTFCGHEQWMRPHDWVKPPPRTPEQEAAEAAELKKIACYLVGGLIFVIVLLVRFG